MQNIIKITLLFLGIGFSYSSYSQCTVVVDTANSQHIDCPNGGAVGGALISPPHQYQSYSWENVTNGTLYNGGGGNGGTSRNDLDAGFYVITASSPYPAWNLCPQIFSDTFEIKEAFPDFQFSPLQACPNLCNVEISASMELAIAVNYSLSIDGGLAVALPFTIDNQCGGNHTYEVFVDGVGCGTENIAISQLGQMNLQTIVTNATCISLGSATVNITSIGASGLNTYCSSSPQMSPLSTTIDFVELTGDSLIISNHTDSVCDLYEDYTTQSTYLTPDSTYNLKINLGSCHPNPVGFLVDLAKVYIDWNIDGVFDANELVTQINPIQSPSYHNLTFTVPHGATPGESRMRVVAQNSSGQSTNSAGPCDYNTAWYGATEDYTIMINGSAVLPITYAWSPSGQSTQTAINLNTDTNIVIITDGNGCTASDTAFVGGTGQVSVTATADQTICDGYAPSSLNASSASAGTYSWVDAADPLNVLGTGSNFPPPPLTTTTIYTVTFTETSSGCIAIDNVTITVTTPTVTLIPVPGPVCIGTNITLTATTSIPVTQYRFQYNDGSGWTNITAPGWNINNPVIYNNITQSTQFRVKVREANGCTASSWSLVETVPVSLITTPPIWHN